MVGRLKKDSQRGFTIIEVLIVLAIAGLIMMIVFLAVPALQRNSRNTQRKDDVSGVMGAIQEVLNNNNGSLAQLTAANIIAAAPTPGYYTYAGNLTVGAAAQANNTTVDTISIRTGARCNGADAANGTTRQIAVLYTIEPSVHQCAGL